MIAAMAYTLMYLYFGVMTVRFLLPRHRPLNRIWLGMSLGLLEEMWLPAIGAFFFSFGAEAHVFGAAVLFVPVLVEYFRTGLVARFPTLIVSGFVAMAAILSLFSGLILQTMVHKNRQDFEMHLISLRERYKQAIAE